MSALSPFALPDFPDACSCVEIDGVSTDLEWCAAGNNNFICESETGKWSMQIDHTASRTILKCQVILPAVVKHLKFSVIKTGNIKIDHLLTGGVKMGRCKAFKTPVETAEEFESYYTTILTRNGKSTLISHPLDQSQYAMVRGKLEGDSLSLDVCSEAHHFAGTTVVFPPVTIAVGDPIEMLDEYGRNNVDVRKNFSDPVPGWNSWDYYRWTVSEEEVLKNAEFIAKDPVLSKHVKRIIVDDGWQYCYGEWYANSLFPSGMKFLADELRKMNFTPGIWLAPSIIEPHCRIAQLEHDMLALSEGGQPCLCFQCMRRYGFVLDPTVEKSGKFLRELFDRMVKDGFEYFKLDFLERTMDAAQFADKSIPRSQIMRLLMQHICDGVANRAEIMGCNYPFMAGNRYVSAARVGSDIHATWHGACENAMNVAYRFWMNKRLWINDPDFAVCRGVDTSDERDRLQPILVFCNPDSEYQDFYARTFDTARKNELEVLLSITLMSGGAVNLSDDVTKLNAAGLDLARKVVSAESGEAAIPLDLCSSVRPTRWLQKLKHGGRALLINWSDDTAEMKLDFPELPAKARDFWHGVEITVPRETVLPPHSCLLLEW